MLRRQDRSAELHGMGENAIRGPGVCAGMGTANSMHIVCEALGMALPGSAPVRRTLRQMIEHVRRSGATSCRWCGRTEAARHSHGRRVPERVAVVLAVAAPSTASSTFRPSRRRPGSTSTCSRSSTSGYDGCRADAVRPNGEGSIEDSKQLAAGAGAQAARAVARRERAHGTGRTVGDNLRVGSRPRPGSDPAALPPSPNASDRDLARLARARAARGETRAAWASAGPSSAVRLSSTKTAWRRSKPSRGAKSRLATCSSYAAWAQWRAGHGRARPSCLRSTAPASTHDVAVDDRWPALRPV